MTRSRLGARGVAGLILLIGSALFGLTARSEADDPADKPAPAEAARPAVEAQAPKDAEQKPAAEKKPAADQKAAADVPAPPDKPETAKPAPDNPLSNLLRGLFGGRGGGRSAEGARDDDGSGNSIGGDETDKRAPHDAEQFALLQKAAAQMRGQNWAQALEILEFLLDRSENSTIRLNTGRRVPLAEEANRLLSRLPEEFRERYRVQHGPAAQQLLAEATAAGDPRRLAVVATRYFHTQAGYEAANRLGSLHFDRGEFGLAARWFNLLMESEAPLTRDASWRLKAVFALRAAGRESASDRLLSELTPRDGKQEYEIGGARSNPRDWLERFRDWKQNPLPPLEEWPVFGGSATRAAVAKGGEPLLLSRWRRPVTESHPLMTQIESLEEDLSDQGRATIPSLFPLMVDDRIIYRTLRGVQVLDASTGEPLWETREGISAERLLLGIQPEDDFEGGGLGGRRRFNAFNFNVQSADFFGGSVDAHPLAGLLFRNGAYGVLASDGQQLFVIEDHAVLSRQQAYYGSDFEPEGNDPYRRSWSTNRLVAYDLKSGRPTWSVGGAAMNEPFDLPLAGTYFLGAPLVDDGELLVVAEREGRISLLALDPATGATRWSQLIAYADTKIERDLARRWWTAQVSAGSGVIICPTTVGWLVGIDRLNHSVLWTQRYTPPSDPHQAADNRMQGEAMLAYSELNTQWCPAAPAIVGNRVVYTPAEEPTLVCLDLFDGTIVWQEPKGEDGLYLAGVFDDRVVVVGRSSISARGLADGKQLWELSLADADGVPSGVGVATSGRYHLPLSSGQLWSIDLAKGSVASKSYLPAGEKPLGNLALYRGMFLSLAAQALTSFDQREAVEREIREAKERNPHDPEALLREADIHRVERRFDEALASLRAIRPEDVNASLRPRYHSAMLECLSAVVRADFQKGERELEELAALVDAPDERRALERLRAERLEARQEFAAAFELLLGVAEAERDANVISGETAGLLVDSDVWLAGKLADLWERMPAEARARFEARLEKSAQAASSAGVAERERVHRVFGFHASSGAVRRQLVEDYAAAGQLVRAENLLLQIARRGEPEAAVSALERLGRLLREAELPEDAELAYRDLAQRFPDARVSGDRTGRQLYDELQKSNAFAPAAEPRPNTWGDVDLRLERTGSGYLTQHVQELETGGERIPFFRNHRLQVDERRQRLEILGARDESQHWLLPLRSALRPLQGDQVVASTAGHLLLVMYGDVLHCLSPVDRKVLWTRVLDARNTGSGYYRVPQRQNPQPLRIGSSLLSRNSLLHLGNGNGMLAAANSGCICLYGRREISVLDPLTGDVRWTLENVLPDAVVFATEEMVFVLPPSRVSAAAYRASDGRPIESGDFVSLLSKMVAIVDGGLVITESERAGGILGLAAGRTVVRLYDPVTRKNVWNKSFPGGTNFSLLDGDRLVCLEASGIPSVVDLVTGEQRTFAAGVSVDELKARADFYALADRDQLYFVANSRRRGGDYFYPEGFTSLPANGSVYAFDFATGQLLWKQSVASQNLVCQFVHHTPALLFASRTMVRNPNRRGSRHWSLSLVALDKRTGRKLIDTQLPSYSGFRTLDLNMAERFIEFRSHNQRVRLLAVERGG